MTREIQVRGKKIRLDPKNLIGQGGEAEVYDIGALDRSSGNLALKVWFPPDHPQFAGNDADSVRNREAARQRLTEYGQKLPRFPSGAPKKVVSPLDLAYDPKTQAISGYTMNFLSGTEPLRSYSQRRFRDSSGVDAATVVRIFADIHETVGALHHSGVVIGDFNNLNVLVRAEDAYLIDADSMQFGGFLCKAFTERYVDPLVCDPKATRLVQKREHSMLTDWYAFAVMLFESLLFVHPYGGVYEPKRKKDQVPLDARPLHRIWVVNPEVVYPVKAQPFTWLPKRVQDLYGEIFSNDRRCEFPRELLTVLEAHAEGRYVDPATIIMPTRIKELMRGDLTARRLFNVSPGVIVDFSHLMGRTNLIVHKDGEFKREDGSLVTRGDRTPDLTARAHGRSTLLTMGGKLVVLDSHGTPTNEHLVDSFQSRFPVLDSNGDHYYWLSDGKLYRDGALGPSFIGDVLTNQTRFWVGPSFGLGFYRVGAGTTAFVFDGKRGGLNDSVKLPLLDGELVDVTCCFSDRRAWLLATLRKLGKLVNHCVVIKLDGTVVANTSTPDGDGSWLGEIGGRNEGHCAARLTFGGVERECLLSVTDKGLKIVAEGGGAITEVGELTGLNGLLDSNSTLYYEPGNGLVAANGPEVWRINHPLLG